MERNKKAETGLNTFLKINLNLCKIFVKSMSIVYILATEGVINIEEEKWQYYPGVYNGNFSIYIRDRTAESLTR